MFYESLIDNMKIGKSYNINKENLIFIEKNNTILDLKYVLEKEAILSKLIKKYDLEPETSIYLYEGNLIGENVLEIKNKEYLFPFLIDRKLYCYGTNEVIKDNTKFYYKNLNVFSESYFNTSGTTLDELNSNQTKVFNNYIDFLEFIKSEIKNSKDIIKTFDKKYSKEAYLKQANIRKINLLREMLRVSFRKVLEPKYYYIGWKDYIKFDSIEEYKYLKVKNFSNNKAKILSKEFKKKFYQKEPEKILYLWKAIKLENTNSIPYFQIKQGERIFPFLENKKLYSEINNNLIEDLTIFYYKDFKIYTEEEIKKLYKIPNSEIKDDIKLRKKYSIRGFRNYFDFFDFVNDMITELEAQMLKFKEENYGSMTIHFYGTQLNNEKDCKREIKKYRDMLKKYFRENKEIKKGMLKRFFKKK